MKVLALDFDGVISDSAPECFWVALRTLDRVRPGAIDATRMDRWSALPADEVADEIRADPLYPGFLDIMPLGNRAEDFGVALLALEAGVSIAGQADYDRWSQRQDPRFAADFHACFYAERSALRDASPARWAGLMQPYTPLIEALRAHRGEVRQVIATAKDRETVTLLVERFGIDDLFPDGSIYDKECGREKREHLKAIQADLETEFDSITFIDDKTNHLLGVKALGVRCLLAAWGYNGPREHELALANGIEVCDLADVVPRAFGRKHLE